MLAQRASTNPELKSVMKIVATGTANQEQLDYFQRHIDELNKIVRDQQQRSAQSTPAAPPQKPSRPNQSSHTTASPASGSQSHPPYHSTSAAPLYASTPTAPSHGSPAAFNPQPYYPPAPPQQRYSPAVTHPQNVRISAVLVEFALDQTSRFLFPPNTILEYMPGFTQCLASFLVKRKAKDAEDSVRYLDLARRVQSDAQSAHAANKEPEDMEFWQPVTVLFKCDNPNTLHVLGRVVRPAEQVRTWMERVLNGGPEKQDDDTKASVVQPNGPNGSNAPASTVKVEPKDDANGSIGDSKALNVGMARAESRKLAMRLPKEDKGKENIDSHMPSR